MMCECQNWASDGRPPLLSHHRKCPKYNPDEMVGIIKDLVKGIECWASDEDGVHPECYDAYSRAKVCIGQFDHLKKGE